MDELLSFELSNAEFNPWIVPTQPQGRLAKFVQQELRGDSMGETLSNLISTVKDVLQNRGGSRLFSYTADVYEEPVWITREEFVDYVTVDEEDDFNYLSVYFNVKDDNHPPLHFMVLHTVSSVFQGRIAPFMGCGINLVCVLGVMILLMKLGRQVMQLAGCGAAGQIVGDGAALLYGLSAGALATVLLIRMYAMLTFFCVALLEIHVTKVYNKRLVSAVETEDEVTAGGFLRGNKTLILVTVLGFWTQYFFLFYCLILAALTVILLLVQKRKKELWRYMRAMVTAAVIGVAVFPFSIGDVFSSGRGVEALGNLSAGLSGYGERLTAFGRILLFRGGALCVGAMCLMSAVNAVLLLLCRKNRPKREQGQDSTRIQARTPGKWCKRLLMMLCIPPLGYFLLAARMSPYLVDRYIMPLFPILILILAMLSYGMFFLFAASKNNGKTWAKRGLLLLLLILSVCQVMDPARYENDYRYQDYAGQEEIAREYAEDPCICVYEGVGYYENLPEFTHYEKTLLVTMEELETRKDTNSVSDCEEVVILLKVRAEETRLREVLAEYGLEQKKVLWRGNTQEDDEVLLFGRKLP